MSGIIEPKNQKMEKCESSTGISPVTKCAKIINKFNSMLILRITNINDFARIFFYDKLLIIEQKRAS